jgi:hypothetical protein
MMSKSVRWQAGVLLLLLLCLPLALRAQMSKHDQDAAKKMIAGTLYLRLDVPLNYVQGAWGLGPEALLEVSPTGHDAIRKISLLDAKKEGRSHVIWALFPNDGVRYGKLSFDHDKIEIWMEGLQIRDLEIKIDFVQIKSLDDFTKAFNQTFSKVPLQDEHPEWSAEVRNAIAEHRLVVGMTKEQAFDVVGTPLDMNTEQENGAKVETWRPRQDKGDMGVILGWRAKSNSLRVTGFPSQLKFVDGKLQVIG